MHLLFLHRLLYKFLHWGGHADARPTEFAATVVSAERRGYGEGRVEGRGEGHGIEPGHHQPPAQPARTASPPEPQVSQIGRYIIKGRLGAGGLGEVFEAWDPLLSRAVAVKTLRLQLDAELRALLDDHILNEARAAAGLSHPNIVTVFDAGLCTPGVYIAMERLHGRDLRQALAAGWRPSAWQAAQLARRVAEALAYAHGKGVVHCDIKPANIFLDQEDRPKVLDFGIARMAHDNQLPGTEDPLFGSPHYLAPEQLQRGVADARTDIRALGVVLYEMLTGRKAFDGDTVEQVVNAVLFNQPAPAHEIRGGVPRALSAIAARAMSHDPERRHASAEELARELRDWAERLAEPAPGAAASNSRASARRAAVVRRRAGTVWAPAGVLLCVATAGWLWWLPSSSPAPRLVQSPARSPAQSTVQSTAQSTTRMEAPSQALSQAQPPAPASADLQAAGATAAAARRPSASVVAPGRPQAADSAHKTLAARETAGSSSSRPPAGEAIAATAAAVKRNQAGESAAGSGAVLLSISPWGQVEVNGQAAGTTPPLSRLSLPAGRHTITVRNNDFPVYTTTVVVQADKPAMVRHRFVQ